MAKKRNFKANIIWKNRLKELKKKEMKIRSTGNKIHLTDNIINDTMEMYHFDNYRIEFNGSIRLVSKHGVWIIEPDEEVIFLWHGNERCIRVRKERDSYHLQNVFFDLDYCVKSIYEHDQFVLQRKPPLVSER